MEKKVVTNSISINKSKQQVWDALVNPEQTRKYMFGCETVSDWKVGDELLWRGVYEGKEMVFVKGVILDIQKEKFLKYTVFDPFASYPDIPENHLNVTYELKEENGATTLKVSQDGFETVADGAKRYHDVYNKGEGWNPILVAIKQLLESN